MSVGITSDAVVFFEDNKVVKELLYPEFEAILDQVVGVGEFKGQTSQAAYVQINAQLHVVAVVFFLIDFDASGNADKSWNVPLKHLADNGGRGPDLGAGPIKLACRSQCSVSWHQRAMWDPDMDPESSTLEQLAQAIKRNRLGLAYSEPSAIKVQPAIADKPKDAKTSRLSETELREQLTQKFQQEIKARSTALLEEQKLRISTMKSEAQDHIEKLQLQYRRELARVNGDLASTKQLFLEEKQKNLQLKETLESKARDFQLDRERLHREIEQSKDIEQSQLLELEEKFELEAQAKFDSASAELKEMLDMREVELFYRDEQVRLLNDQVSQLREEKQSLTDGTGDRVLKKLVESGITFVAFQPGVDHLTISLRDMARYLESPTSYVAEKCNVDIKLYQKWLAHYNVPACNHSLSNGKTCGEPVPRIEKPAQFMEGESDCCVKHSRSANALSALMKVREASRP